MKAPQDLPEHMADGGEWREWPRKLDAHLKWGLRPRQIEAFLRTGKLTNWKCPDGSFRIDPDALRELFGEPVTEPGARDLNAAERRKKQAEAEPDPVVAMLAKTTVMLSEMHQASIGLLKIISDPMGTLLKAYEAALGAQATRIVTLEKQVDEAAVLRSELADAAQEREMALKRFGASEKRRDETLAMLKEEFPKLVATWLSGDSLSGWAKRTPKDVVGVVAESDGIAERDAEIMRQAAGIPKPAPQPNNANGVSDHGNS